MPRHEHLQFVQHLIEMMLHRLPRRVWLTRGDGAVNLLVLGKGAVHAARLRQQGTPYALEMGAHRLEDFGDARRVDHSLRDHEIPGAEPGIESTTETRRDHERRAEPFEERAPARVTQRGAEPDRGEPNRTTAEGRKREARERWKLELAGQRPRLELNGGEDQERGHCPMR